MNIIDELEWRGAINQQTDEEGLRKLTEEESIALFGKNIKVIPKLYIDNSVLNYIVISFDNFVPNATNPEFRDCVVMIDIICHTDYWDVGNFRLRPLKIAGYIDGILNNCKLSGIGTFQFMGCSEVVLSEELSGYCLMYAATHGADDYIEDEE